MTKIKILIAACAGLAIGVVAVGAAIPVKDISDSNFQHDQTEQDVLNAMVDDIDAVRDAVAGNISGSVAFDPADLADGAGETKVVTCTGAALGDFVIGAVTTDLQDQLLTCYVQAADTCECRLQNESGAARNTIDLGTLRVRVIPFTVPAQTVTK